MQFTKQEAANLLGQKVELIETIYFEVEDLKFSKVEKGVQAEVYLIENQSEEITISLLIDDQYETFNKTNFHKYCQILNSETVNHARSV
jgi:hypothetical protein